MVEALRDGGQVILLLNRRGFSTHIQCPACGVVLKCEHCDLALTYHRQHNTALCHYCDHEAPPPRACPDCKSPAIRYGGVGTQKLEEEVRARFPDYKCARMDVDSMRQRGSHDNVLVGVPARRGPNPARHADDRQGARLSERHARRRDQRRHGAAPARLPGGGADVSTRRAGRRPHRPRRAGRPRAGANAQSRTSRRSWRRCGTITRGSPTTNWRRGGPPTTRRSRR